VRRKPTQKRSVDRIEAILACTSTLLESRGLQGLTTRLIAKELNISVGALYHYFPNKHAILHAMVENWLALMSNKLSDMQGWSLSDMPLAVFVDQAVDLHLSVYRAQKGVLHLIQAMFAIPELQHLDRAHDALVIEHMMEVFKQLGLHTGTEDEIERLGRAYLELTHALLLTTVIQTPERSARTLVDLKRLTFELLRPYQHADHQLGLVKVSK
jgi:AcrR family transcriptional regulator